MEGKKVIIRDFGPNLFDAINVMNDILGGNYRGAMDAVASVPQTVTATDDQIERLRGIGAVVDVLDETASAEIPSAAPEFAEVPAVKPAEAARAKSNSPDAKSWHGWETMPDGHAKAVTAMRALRDHADHYRSELRRVRQELADEKDNSQRIYESVTENARQTCSRDTATAETECKNNMEKAERARGYVTSTLGSSNYFVSNLPKVGSVIKAATAEDEAAKQQAAVVFEKIAKKVELYKQLRNARIATAERARQDKIDKARQEQIDRDEQSERKFKLRNQQLQEECRRDIEEGFNKETTSAYTRDVQASRFNADNFECVDSVPDYVMLGKIGLSLPDADADDIAVVQAVDLQTSKIGDKSSSEYSVEIPYAQKLYDGISLLMRYTPENRQFVQSRIQDIVMKLFLSFPAGKIEATMIDPLALGASFPDIPKLGASPNTARVIDTKVWSNEKDIEKCISTLRQRLENMTQDYGDDRASRLRKEPVRVLAITDFPVNFNESALKDLHAIVRNSASLGVCVFICANDKELENLKGRSGALFDEIMGSMVQTRAEGNRLMMTSPGDEGLYIRLDDMSDVEANKSSIIEYLIDAVIHGVRRLETFEELYSGDIYDSNTWGLGDQTEIAVPIGIKGADNVVKFVVGRGGGSTEHHALVSGLTGAGKSTFLHTLITSTMISYRPEDVQMYILDFKEGVEFNVYTKYRLPSLRVVAINSEREFGLTVLKELCNELEVRTKHFARYGVTDIGAYQKLMDVPKVPKLLLIFDEVQELFRSKGDTDSISSECLSCINKLVMQGRAMGIHIVLATQDFRNCAGLEQFFTQMSIRIAIAGTEEGASSILKSDNDGIRALQNMPPGSAIYNNGGGVKSANNFFQIAYLSDVVRDGLLECLDAYYRDPAIAPMYEDDETRILLTNAEENMNNCFNRLIREGSSSLEPLGDNKGGYGLLLGQGFGKKSTFVPVIRRGAGENMLVVTKDEKTAVSLFELSTMSLLYDELNTDADKGNALIYIADLSDDVTDKDECDFDYLCRQFERQLEVAKLKDVNQLIDDLYEIVMGRAEGRLPQDERIFLLFFGLNRARMLTTAGIYEGTAGDELRAADKLNKILTAGPRLGVNAIIWSESIKGTEAILGQGFDRSFNRRVAYGLPAEDMDRLVAETDSASLRGKTAVYMNIAEDIKNTHFRPYDVPAKVWIERYAEVYEEIVESESTDDGLGGNGGYAE